MAEHDSERIAALAAGLLSPAEAEALEREIAGDPRAAAELAAHRLALGAFRDSPAPVLSAEERTELRRKVAEALNLGDVPAPRPAATRRRVAWRPLAVAAAALAVIAAVVPLSGLLSIGEDQAALTTVAATMTAREEAGDSLATAGPLSDGSNTTALGEYATTTLESARGAAALAAETLADPRVLLQAAEPGFDLCAEEGRETLGTRGAAGGLLVDESGDFAAWFLIADGAVDRVALFDPIDCRLLATAP